VFALSTNGTGFITLHHFPAVSGPDFTNSDGANPYSGLVLSGNALYGTTDHGGISGNGVVFRRSLGPPSGPPLTVFPYGTSVLLVWPTNPAGFHLQFTTNLISSTVWKGGFPAPIVIGEDNVVVEPTSGDRKFYRLSQ
jgi:uncharacterized repeat protein (TIGR03803 family)